MTTLNKTDVAGLLRDLQGQLSDAIKQIGTDPAAAMNLLTQAQAAIDVASDVSAANPASPEAPIEKIAAPAATPVVEPPAAPGVPEAVMAILQKQQETLESLQESISKMSTAPVDPGVIPLGDLNSIVDTTPVEISPLVKALNDGDLQGAFKAVGNDTNKLYDEVNNLAVKQLVMQGINVSRFGIFALPEDQQ